MSKSLKSQEIFVSETSMTDLSLLSIPGTLTAFNNLEWCHHAGIMLKETSCNEEKIRRQQRKKGEVTSFKTVTSSKDHMWKSSQLIKAKNYTAIGRRSS